MLEEDAGYKIIGACYSVQNTYGSGMKEQVYQKALVELLEKIGFKVEQQKRINIYSVETGKVLGTYVPDLIVDDKIVIEIKATQYTIQKDINQQLSYLKASKYEIAYLVNFGTSKVEIKKSIYTNDRKPHIALLNRHP